MVEIDPKQRNNYLGRKIQSPDLLAPPVRPCLLPGVETDYQDPNPSPRLKCVLFSMLMVAHLVPSSYDAPRHQYACVSLEIVVGKDLSSY